MFLQSSTINSGLNSKCAINNFNIHTRQPSAQVSRAGKFGKLHHLINETHS